MVTVAVMLLAGCKAAETRPAPRIEDQRTAVGALTPAALREAYHTPAFVVRVVRDGAHVAFQDTAIAADSQLDDTNLLIYAEGSADSLDGFRHTAALLAESRYGFATQSDQFIIVVVKWSQGINPIAEHLNRPAQEAGAVVLAGMLRTHWQRHGAAGHVSLVGFSAGTRVIQIADDGAQSGDPKWHPEAFAAIDNVVFLGSSVGYTEEMHFGAIRGRFVNFVNPRDSHFGDRAAYIAPAGTAANPLKLLNQATLQRRPRYGASATGFQNLATLTTAAQFDALDLLARTSSEACGCFRMVNVPVPMTLVAYNVFGSPLLDDDMDDYVNMAPNHYVMVGRGPGGNNEMPDFKQYRAMAEEFVRNLVAPAVFRGRLYQFDLKSLPKGANPLGLPLPVPWAILPGMPDKPAGAGNEPKEQALPGGAPAPQK
jgi:hypothetical protein